MATAALTGSSHLGVTDNQKRWLVAGIALNKILIPQIRPFVEQGINTEYNNLKTSHNIHGQSTSGRLQRWPARKLLKYENINGNDAHPRLPRGRFNYSLFDCRVTSHVDFARLYVENYMAKFTAFDDHCDASAVLSLLSGVPVFSAAVQTTASDVRMARNDWAHCVFSKWDEAKFQQSFIEMEHLVNVMALPAADEKRLLGELNDWETKGTHLCMSSPIDPALLQLVQQELKSLQDVVDNMSEEFEEEKKTVQRELQNLAKTLQEMNQRVQRLETEQQNLECRTEQIESRMGDFEGNANQRLEKLEISQQSTESHTVLVEERVDHLQEQVDDLAKLKGSNVTMSSVDSPAPAGFPQKLVELIRRKYKGAVLCPFPWCEELQLQLSNIFTRLKIVGKKKERTKLTKDVVHMTDVFRPHEECEEPRVVLIEGQPGMGKTTYCQKFAYDWSVEDVSPEACFPKVKMLLLLKCRDMKTANIEEAIVDQLLPLDADKKEKENFFRFIRCNQSRILLVLDGLDELSENLFEGLLPLIQRRIFSDTYLMLTARHEAGMNVRRHCDTLLEIVGYTSKDTNSYIRKYFANHDDPSLAKKMINNLQCNSQLRELTANPLNTALMCLVFEDAQGIFPYNRTLLYYELVSCALRRNFSKKGIPLDNKDPIEVCTDQLNQLGKLALDALVRDQLAFTTEELRGHSAEFLEFGLLSREASASKIKPKPSYAFTHKTFQEYFAAFHLAHELLTGDKDKAGLLSQLSPVNKYWQVWEFLITMASSKSDDVAVLLVSRLCASFQHKNLEHFFPDNYVPEEEDSDDDNDDSSDSNIECMDPYFDDDDDDNSDGDFVDVCDDDCKNCYDYGFDFDVCKDTSFDCFTADLANMVLAGGMKEIFFTKTIYLIAQCEPPESELKVYQKEMAVQLARCFPQDKLKVGYTYRYASFASPYILVLSEYMKVNCQLTGLIWLADLDQFALATIEDVIQSSLKLTYLHLANDLRSTSLSPVLQANRTLTHLNLRNARIRIAGAKALGEVLQSNCTLTHVSLPGNAIAHIGAEALARGLQSNNVLVHLDIRDNWIGDQGAVALAEALKSNRTLTYFNVGIIGEIQARPDFFRPSSDFDDVKSDWIRDSGITAIARSLRSNSSLTYLDLQGNSFSDLAAAELGEALQSNCTLTHLYLRGFRMTLPGIIHYFGNSAAAAFSKALQSCTKLACLDLCNTSITSSCAIILGKALQSNCTLVRLDLSCNKIGCSGAAALAKALKSNRTLTHLQLRNNKISHSGATQFAEALQSNRTLVYLDLISNTIKCSAAAAIARALKSNRTLTHLQLGWNKIGDSGAMEFAETLQCNKTLVFLSLRCNQITESGKQILRRIKPLISCTLRW